MSNIVSDFYNGRHIFVTGATGFMGKVLVEKLLRSCPNVERIYVLIRPKRKKEAQERLNEILSTQIFDLIREKDASLLNKIVAVKGDITEPGLGICCFDSQLLSEKVEVVFHCAATVNFEEQLSQAVKKNLVGTQEVVNLCKTMNKLMSFVYVSTAYSNCDRKEVTEQFYRLKQCYKDILKLTEALDDESLEILTPRLLGGHPNTYTFSKNLAEQFLSEEACSIPITIVRPSIVTGALNEPFKGWVEGNNGLTGFMLAIGKGAVKVLNADVNTYPDIIPVDVAVNLCIVSAWHKTTIARIDTIPIYNGVLGESRKLNFGDLCRMMIDSTDLIPYNDLYGIPEITIIYNFLFFRILCIYKQWIPSCIGDILAVLLGKKTRMVQGCQKMDKLLSSVSFFTKGQWTFRKPNTLNLWHSLSKEVQQTFFFSTEKIDWTDYIQNYIAGGRQFILKNSTNSIPKARLELQSMRRNRKLRRMMVLIVAIWFSLWMSQELSVVDMIFS